MKRLILIVLVGLLAFSCRTKTIIYTRKPIVETQKTETQKVTTPKVETQETGTRKVETSKVETRKVETSKVVIKKEDDIPVVKYYANATEKYIDAYKAIAQKEMELYDIPASITLAQGILESASGNGRLSVEANNHFGIKCHGWTGEKIYHDDDATQECFRKYDDAKYSFRDHSLFLKERSRYSKLFELKKEDYEGWAKGLRAAGYATDMKYPEKLISLIERYKLYELDKGILGYAYKKNDAPSELNTSGYLVAKGDTLYSISRKFNLTVKDLKKLNGLRGTDLSIGQQLIVKP